MTIIIDPGHGGSDPGAVGPTGIREKDVVLEIGKLAAYILENKGYDVRLTRKKDIEPSWPDRVESNPDDIFISIHCNAVGNRNVRGIETWHYTGSKNGEKLAKLIQGELIERADMKDRGIKHNRNFYVLRKTRCPAVLIETGFISNPEEEKVLDSLNYQVLVVVAIVEALKRYFA